MFRLILVRYHFESKSVCSVIVQLINLVENVIALNVECVFFPSLSLAVSVGAPLLSVLYCQFM